MASGALLDGFGIARASAVADRAQFFALNDHINCYACEERKQRQLDIMVRISGAPVLAVLVAEVPAGE